MQLCLELPEGGHLHSILDNLRTANEFYLFEYFLNLEIHQQNTLRFQNCVLLHF